MDVRVRRAALRAAAKVSLGVLFFGCGSTAAVAPATPGLDTGPGLPPDDSTADASVADTADASVEATGDTLTATTDGDASSEVEPRPDAPLACLDWVTSIEAGVTPSAFDCCLKEVGVIVPESGFADAAVIGSDASMRNCCRALVAAVEADTSLYGKVGTPVISACCTGLSYPTSSMCTPWGPPVPPSMNWAIDWVPEQPHPEVA
jgi:hypothetical protein